MVALREWKDESFNRLARMSAPPTADGSGGAPWQRQRLCQLSIVVLMVEDGSLAGYGSAGREEAGR
jgi:hypothetical protein